MRTIREMANYNGETECRYGESETEFCHGGTEYRHAKRSLFHDALTTHSARKPSLISVSIASP
jgi:hypothetical protein